MKTILLLTALAFVACSVVQKNDTPNARICHLGQDCLNVPDGAPSKCLSFVETVTPKLRSAGATNIRWITMSVAGQHSGHILVGFTADGHDWLADNGLGPVHAVGSDTQEQIMRFCNRWTMDAPCNVSLISETKIK